MAEGRGERLRGLLFRPPLTPGEALLLPRARSVHAVGMHTPITVVWLDAGLRVLEVRLLQPGRLVLPRRRARHVLEGAPGVELHPGDLLRPAGSPPSPSPRVSVVAAILDT